jgi:hypothetical protein
MDDALLKAVHEIRDLIQLLAEPAIAERDKKLRTELRRIVGKSAQKSKAVLLMDGSHAQRDISSDTGISSGNLSTFVKQLNNAKLLSGDGKEPKLAISIPPNFFEMGENDER